MKLPYWLPLLLLVPTACSTLRDTALLQDDVYSIPDRSAVAAAPREGGDAGAPSGSYGQDDYYSPSESRSLGTTGQDYYNLTYNDPYYYNYGRFGFGGMGGFGPGYGMGFSYGWPTSFGSMSIGYGAGWGYDPYWNNSWMSGYGAWPYAGYGDPYGYYGYGNYGYGYGGYGMGYGYYQGPWGRCYGCYNPSDYGNVVYTHRPSMSGGSGGYATTAPRLLQRPANAPSRAATTKEWNPVQDRGNTRMPAYNGSRGTTRNQGRISAPAPSTPSRTGRTRPERTPTFDLGRDNGSFRSTGGGTGGGSIGGGGGRVTSPRPR